MPGYVYILTNHSRTLYIGMSDDIHRRVFEHKTMLRPECFTAKYQVNQLVYFEELADGHAALAREAQLKRWTRAKKIALVDRVNARWVDLSDRWYTVEDIVHLRYPEPSAVVPLASSERSLFAS